MCLGEICQVVGHEPNHRARVRGEAREQTVSLMTLEGGVEPGDWIVVHSGFALQRLEVEEAQEALALRATTTVSEPAVPAEARVLDAEIQPPTSSSEIRS